MGLKAWRPEVCQGMRQLPTPFSIALMIWDVTVSYTSRFSVAVFLFVDIGVSFQNSVFRDRAKSAPIAALRRLVVSDKPTLTSTDGKSTGLLPGSPSCGPNPSD